MLFLKTPRNSILVLSAYDTAVKYQTPFLATRQRDFALAVKAAGKRIELIEAPNCNHYEMGESFGNPYGPSGPALALMQLLILG